MIKQLTSIAMAFLTLLPAAFAQFDDWQHSGSLCILTPEGANLPSAAVVENFPLLVRLEKQLTQTQLRRR